MPRLQMTSPFCPFNEWHNGAEAVIPDRQYPNQNAAQECAAYAWITLYRVVISDHQNANEKATQECAAYV